MAMKRGRPGSPKVRGGKNVGPDYPETNFSNPFNMGIDEESGSDEGKTLYSPTSTPEGIGPLREDYDELWRGK